MRTSTLRLAVIAVAAAFAGNAGAIDFLETYRLGRQNDAAFAASRASLEAGLEKLPQGRALLLPVINGTANTIHNDVNNQLLGSNLTFNSNGYNITLTQPLFRWQNLIQYKQSEFQVLQSEAQFGQATQDLIVRVAQAYFDVLAAQDNLEFTKANKISIAEQLAQAKRNFEVGTATITDTNEAQARFDLAGAQEIAGLNALEVAWRALQQIIGEVPNQLTPLKAVAMNLPVPNVMDDWAKAARGNNFVVRGNEAVFEIATREIDRQRAGHYPTVDVVTSYADSTTVNPNVLGPRNTINQGQVGLQFSLPIFAGGSVLSRTREAVALREKARQDLEASRRSAEFNARQSYLNVTNGLAQVKALEQALVSSETALQSNRVGYEVGVRINIDVLNAQQQVFQTKRDLARARYDTILNGLRLKSAAGSLTEGDVEAVNALLGFDPSAPSPSSPPPPKPASSMFLAPETESVAPGMPGPPLMISAASLEKPLDNTAGRAVRETVPIAPVSGSVVEVPPAVALVPVVMALAEKEDRLETPVAALPAAHSVAAPERRDLSAPATGSAARKSNGAPIAPEANQAVREVGTANVQQPVSTAAEPRAEEPPIRVYSLVEPKIPGRAAPALALAVDKPNRD